MRLLGSSLFAAALAAISAITAPSVSAQTIFVGDTHIHHCLFNHDHDGDRDALLCNGRKAFSLAAFQAGLIHLPIERHAHRDFVLVNDTGAPVKLLQFSYVGTLTEDNHLRCRIDGITHKVFQSCTISNLPEDDTTAGANNGTADLDLREWFQKHQQKVNASPEFSYLSGAHQAGIPAGAYFDIFALGFRINGDNGYLTGEATPTVASTCVGTPASSVTAAATTGTRGLSAPLQTPAICWAAPAAITYGTALSSQQLDANSGTPGTFTYSPASGAVLNPGTQTLTATFTPSNRNAFATAVATTSLTVNQGSETVLTAARNADPNNPVLLTVTVTVQPSGQPATGTITIYDTTNWVQASVPLVNGQATWAVPSSLTSLTVYAVYSGDGSIMGSTSAPIVGPDEMAILYPSSN